MPTQKKNKEAMPMAHAHYEQGAMTLLKVCRSRPTENGAGKGCRWRSRLSNYGAR